MEEARADAYLGPGADDGNDAEEDRKAYEDQAQSVHGKVNAGAELRNPWQLHVHEPGTIDKACPACVARPEVYREHGITSEEQEGYPSRPDAVSPPQGPGEKASDERYDDNPDKDHINSFAFFIS